MNASKSYISEVEALHMVRQGFKNQVLKHKLTQQSLLDSADLYIKPVIAEQEKANTSRYFT